MIEDEVEGLDDEVQEPSVEYKPRWAPITLAEAQRISAQHRAELGETILPDEEARAIAQIEGAGIPKHMSPEFTDYTCYSTAELDMITRAGRENSNVFIAGPTGVGKTHVACLILRARAYRGKTIQRVKEFDFRNLFECLRFSDGKSFRYLVQDAKNAGVLLWEDFGKCRLSEDEEGAFLTPFGSIVFEILDHRAEHRLPVIITTQYTGMTGLRKVAGAAMIRRVLIDPIQIEYKADMKRVAEKS